MVGKEPAHRARGGGLTPVDAARLAYMANQIARNFAVQGEEAAIAATARHIRDFWDPRMKAAILAGDRQALEPVARAAVAHLADQAGAGSQ
ncbi:MAG: formate dehydrogenase subunit delta [Novosphingobium sp.]